MAAAAILKNLKTPYLGGGWTDFDEICHGDCDGSIETKSMTR